MSSDDRYGSLARRQVACSVMFRKFCTVKSVSASIVNSMWFVKQVIPIQTLIFFMVYFFSQAFSLLFLTLAFCSDLICLMLLPVHWLFFAASTYVWVQFVWHTGITNIKQVTSVLIKTV